MLTHRQPAFTVPSYSVSGDLLAYLDCGLKYRFQHQGKLPPSRPVQFWGGQFLHGMMEEAQRHWQERTNSWPWPDGTIETLAWQVDRRLKTSGLSFRGFLMFGISLERAFVAIETWGPLLFPFVTDAETRLRAVRPMPAQSGSVRGDRYEIQGVADVVGRQSSAHLIAGLHHPDLPTLSGEQVELLIDYKGMRRPAPDSATAQQQTWQLHVYAWIQGKQSTLGVDRLAMVVYLSELAPGPEDMIALWQEIRKPEQGASIELPPIDRRVVEEWPHLQREWIPRLDNWAEHVRDWYMAGEADAPFPRMPRPRRELSWQTRFNRSLRLIGADPLGVDESLTRFDEVVTGVEQAVARELAGEPVIRIWPTNASEERCSHCDIRGFCPDPQNRFGGAPSAP